MDIATGSMRWFRHPDSAILATLNLATGQFNVNNLLTAGDIKSSFDVTATGAVYARSFRFIETGNDTGFDSSGDGYGTMLSNGQPVLQIQPGGNVYVWGNLTAFSDRRMKENIGIIEDPMAIIEQMVGVSFTKIGDPEARPQVGFIAQDVQDVLPHLIQSSHDGMLGVNYAAYVAVLNEGLKELALKVKRLEAHVHA